MNCEKQRMMNKTKRRSQHLCMHRHVSAFKLRVKNRKFEFSLLLIHILVVVGYIFRFGFSFSPEIVRVRAELTKQQNSCRVVNFGIILDIKKKEDEKERNNQCGETNTMKTQQ